MEMDANGRKAVIAYLLWVHCFIAVKNLALQIFDLFKYPEYSDALSADLFVLGYVVFEGVQFVIFLVAGLCVEYKKAKPHRFLLNASVICLLLDFLFLIGIIYKLNCTETENKFESNLRSLNLDEYTEKEMKNERLSEVFQATRWCIMKMIFDFFSAWGICRLKGLLSTQQDVHCEEGNESAVALNATHYAHTSPQYPVQPEGNVCEPSLNTAQSSLLHSQYPVQPKGILAPY